MEKYPCTSHHRNNELPRVSGILKVHPDSLHYQLHFGNCTPEFRNRVEQRAIDGNIVHAAALGLNRRQKNMQMGRCIHTDTPMQKPNASIQQMIDRYKQWLLQEYSHRNFALPPDKTVYSPSLGYCGTPDVVIGNRSSVDVIDIKTGKRIHDVNWLQVAAYAHLLQETAHFHIRAVGILLLDSKAKFPRAKLVRRTDFQAQVQEFLRYRDNWYRLFPESPRIHPSKQCNRNGSLYQE